jgi:hypothetical protein
MEKRPHFLAEFWRFLRSTPPAANIFAVGTMLFWAVKAVYLDHLPPAFPGAFELGRVVEGVLAAIIAGWVFYMFFALLPEFREKNTIYPFILSKVARVAGDCESLLREFEKASGEQLSFARSNEDDLAAAFLKIPSNSSTSLILRSERFATWLELFRYRRDRTRNTMRDILNHGHYLEAGLAVLLLKVNENAFFSVAESMDQHRVVCPHLSTFTSLFFHYMVDCRALAKWHDTHCRPPQSPILPGLG